MGEVVGGKCPVSVHGAEVLDLELDQRASQIGAVSKVLSKGVGLKLVATAEDVHQELDDGVHGAEDIREEEEPNDDGMLLVEAKVGIERVVVDKDREQREDVEKVDLKSH
jgi:hypothetical protein